MAGRPPKRIRLSVEVRNSAYSALYRHFLAVSPEGQGFEAWLGDLLAGQVIGDLESARPLKQASGRRKIARTTEKPVKAAKRLVRRKK